MSEERWFERMNGMPVGILIIEKRSKRITYRNKSILKVMRKVQRMKGRELERIEESLLNELTFKILDMRERDRRVASFLNLLSDLDRTVSLQRKASVRRGGRKGRGSSVYESHSFAC